MPEHPVIYVDLIKDEPMSRDEWITENPSRDPDFIDDGYRRYLDRFQPWRWHAKSEGNMAIIGNGERYFNEDDAEHNIRLQYANGSIVYLRRHEQGNEMIRDVYPKQLGDTIVIGPECFAMADGSVLCWRGVNYIPQPDPAP